VVAVTTLRPPRTPAQAPLAEVQEALELELPGEPVRRPRLRLVARDGSDLERVAARFSQTLVEVLTGDRGAHQLLRWTTPEVYDLLLRRSATVQRASANAAPSRRLRAQVRSVHLSRPQPEAAELSIHVRQGARSRAVAARLDLVDGRWLCSAVQFG
jgi:hypothetical protein